LFFGGSLFRKRLTAGNQTTKPVIASGAFTASKSESSSGSDRLQNWRSTAGCHGYDRRSRLGHTANPPMPATDVHVSIPRHGRVSMVLHWLLALMIITSFSVGLCMVDMPFSMVRLRLYNWHKWAGVTILLLSALRLFWRLAHRPPPLGVRIEAAMPRWQRVAHQVTLVAMYLLFIAVPLLGWASTSSRGYPIVWFAVWPLPDFVPVDRDLADHVFAPLHRAGAFLLAGLVLLHVMAVLKHQFIDHDGLLARMWPAPRKQETP
jgi:cytochrome b561